MCVYMRTYVCVCVYGCVFVFKTRSNMVVCEASHILQLYIYIYIYIHVCVYIHIYIRMFVWDRPYTNICTCKIFVLVSSPTTQNVASLSLTHAHTNICIYVPAVYRYNYTYDAQRHTQMMHKDILKYKSWPEPWIICEIKRINSVEFCCLFVVNWPLRIIINSRTLGYESLCLCVCVCACLCVCVCVILRSLWIIATP